MTCAATAVRFLAWFGRAGAVQRTVSAAHQARKESAAILNSTPRVSLSLASFLDPGRANVALPGQRTRALLRSTGHGEGVHRCLTNVVNSMRDAQAVRGAIKVLS